MLQGFLRTGTYTASAEQLALHKNSVQHCTGKAEEALGGRLEDRRADLWLDPYVGQAVARLVDAGSGRAGWELGRSSPGH